MATATNAPAAVKVSGFGLLGDRDLVRLLHNFQLNGRMPATIDRTFVEDAALVLLARAGDEGYLHARLRADFTLPDGSRRQFAWTNVLDVSLPRDFAARAAHFRLKGGVQFYYQTLEFDGVTAFSRREAQSYFFSADMLLKLRRNRVSSPAALSSSLAALREAYARAGYQDVVVTASQVVETSQPARSPSGSRFRKDCPPSSAPWRSKFMGATKNSRPPAGP